MVSIFSDAPDPSVRTLKHMCEGLGRQVIDLREEVEETKGKIETLRTWLWDRNRHEEFQKLCELLGDGR